MSSTYNDFISGRSGSVVKTMFRKGSHGSFGQMQKAPFPDALIKKSQSPSKAECLTRMSLNLSRMRVIKSQYPLQCAALFMIDVVASPHYHFAALFLILTPDAVNLISRQISRREMRGASINCRLYR